MGPSDLTAACWSVVGTSPGGTLGPEQVCPDHGSVLFLLGCVSGVCTACEGQINVFSLLFVGSNLHGGIEYGNHR